jgi:hypothetical protein
MALLLMAPLNAPPKNLGKKFTSLQADAPPSTQQGTDDLTAWSFSRNEVVFDWQSTQEFTAPQSDPTTSTKPQSTLNDDAVTQARSTYTTDINTTISKLNTVFTELIALHNPKSFINLCTTSNNNIQQQQPTTTANNNNNNNNN